jgi:hypothetical protein
LANFLAWKIFVDQRWRKDFKTGDTFRLDAVVCTHSDYDHYGEFLDMHSWFKDRVLDVGTLFHCDIGRYSPKWAYAPFKNGRGFGQLGSVEGPGLPKAYLTTLIDDAASIENLTEKEPGRSWKLGGFCARWPQPTPRRAQGGQGRRISAILQQTSAPPRLAGQRRVQGADTRAR